MNWETVIGLETHVELATKSKIFCSCSTQFSTHPNTQCCPVCTGMPGALPVLNRAAVELAVDAGLALNCTVSPFTRFDRKNYFYPDLPKAYQISQLYLPLCTDGRVELNGFAAGIHEVHLEEDAGKLIHDGPSGFTKVDYNRCGIPLIEIVTRPDFRTAQQVTAYLEWLRRTLQQLGVSDCRMEQGSLRCDVNLSVRPAGSQTLGTRTEMKNLGSFRAVARAIEYESARQIALLESGGQVVQETRRWDEQENRSLPMRTKENARDYRYFPDPDLPPVCLSQEFIDARRAALPELPGARMARFIKDFALPEYDADMLTGSRPLADFFEACTALGAPARQVSNWILGPCLRRLNADGLRPEQLPLSPASLARLIALVETGKLNRPTAVTVFDAVFATGQDVDEYVTAHALEQTCDTDAIRTAIEQVLSANEKSAADYRAGKEKAFGFLVGQSMRALGGKANPKTVSEILSELLRQ